MELRLGFLASHNGTNMQAIIDACRQGRLDAAPCAVISNNSRSGALERARNEGIPYYHLSGKTHPVSEKLDKAILDAFRKNDVNLVILAGYMKKLGPLTLFAYRNRILNIHPALLPKFGGKGMYGENVHKAVLASGDRVSGVTIHIVDAEYDHGHIVAQAEVPVADDDTPDSLAARVLKREHEFFSETLQKIAEGEIVLPIGRGDLTRQKKWQRFEDLVAQIQRTLTPQSKVTENDRIRGRRTKGLRQIDISIRHKVGQYEILIVMDCKDYKRPVDVKHVEEFMGLVDDVGANKGAIVSASGFTKTAKERAKDAGVDLYRLVDAEKHEWRTYVSVPTLCDFRTLESFKFILEPKGPFVIKEELEDARRIALLDQNGQLLDYIGNLLAIRWNSDLLPRESGEHTNIRLTDKETFINMKGELYSIEARVDIKVRKELYFGQWSILEIKGFEDQVKGGLLTTGFTTDFLSTMEVEKNWQRISSEEDLAIKPVFTLMGKNNCPLIEVKRKEY
jgi:phosphoribosylglycinamide formyltransferase-1